MTKRTVRKPGIGVIPGHVLDEENAELGWDMISSDYLDAIDEWNERHPEDADNENYAMGSFSSGRR